jgi:hypothetical protein
MAAMTHYDFIRIGGIYGRILFWALMLIPGYLLIKHIINWWKERKERNAEAQA